MNEDQILEAMGMNKSMDDATKAEVLRTLHQTVTLKFSQAAAQLLTKEQLKEFAELQDNGATDNELNTWFAQALPDKVQLEEAMYRDTIEEMRIRLNSIVGE